MNSIIAFLTSFAPIVEPILLNVEQNTIQPKLKALIDTVPDADLKMFLQGVDTALDALIKAEISKI